MHDCWGIMKEAGRRIESMALHFMKHYQRSKPNNRIAFREPSGVLDGRSQLNHRNKRPSVDDAGEREGREETAPCEEHHVAPELDVQYPLISISPPVEKRCLVVRWSVCLSTSTNSFASTFLAGVDTLIGRM